MSDKDLEKLRYELKFHSEKSLEKIYLEHKENCVNVLVRKQYTHQEKAEELFIDAILIFRENMLSGKIQQLSSLKSYLIGVCINLVKSDINKKVSQGKKVDDVRLLLYNNNYNISESQDDKRLKLALDAFNTLSEKCKKIIVAFYVYKVSMKDIAQELGFANADVAKMTKSRCYKSWMKATEKLKNEDNDHTR